MIKQARKDYVQRDLEKQIQEFWRRTQAYEKTRKMRGGGKDFYFVDGPPYTTGSIHLGTALNKTIKDSIVRWRRMQGFNVRDQPGYDMHGLPIEVQVERSLGITNKQQIEDFGIEKFVTTCRQFSVDLLAKMTEQFQSIGVWLDWDNPYMTTKSEFIEAEWWTLKRAHERGLLTRDVRSLQWCTRCETALAEAEIEYSDETDPSIYVRFPLKERQNESLVIWTTTPWTLPANLAVSVHPDFTYARVDPGTGGSLWILEDTASQVLAAAGLAGQVVERKKGAELVGWAYEYPLADKVPYHANVPAAKAHTVLASSDVVAEHTGLVHTAPGHGPEDFDLGKANDLPPFSPVDERGIYTAEAGAYAGKHVREANDIILKDLEEAHVLLHRDKIVHRYGHCWRCRTPIVFRVTEQWFLRVAPIKEKMLSEIKRIQWTPDWAGSARQWEWTQNLRDWCISRQRYWGTPVPLWVCEKCGDLRVIGSADDLRVGQNYKEGMDLHRPWIDGVTFRCTKCGSLQRRVRDVLDVWFDSAVSSWAQLGYPRDKAQFQRWWPVDWIVEGNDQTRGWFNSQMFAGVIAFDRAPYESVVLHGWVNGPDGRQMHRHLGNYIEPFEVVEKHGVDAFRLYLLRSNAPWEDITFNWEDVKNAGRTLNILFNVFKFATMYMAMDRFDPESSTIDSLVKHMTPEDKWLLSRVERVKGTVTANLERYELHRAARALEEFVVEDLSRWYVKLIRDRTWREGEDRGKLAAEAVLYEALLTTSKLLAPLCPHLSEEIYQGLDGRLLTVHMSDWPKPREDFLNANLENAMNTVRDLVDVVAKVRQKENVKLRWPVRTVTLRGPTPEAVAALGQLKHVFLDMANMKRLDILPADSPYADLELALVPDPQAIGKVYKAWWSKIATILELRSAAEVQRDLDEKGEYRIGIEGQMIKILPNMVKVEHRLPKGVVQSETPYGELFVDLRVTDEIRAEGMAREVVRRVQQMRKDLDLDVEDYVRTAVKAPEEFVSTLGPLRGYIERESRSRTLTLGTSDVDEEYVVEWPNVDGVTLLIGVTPLHAREALQSFTSIGLSERKAFSLFDAGYKTLASVKSASREELLAIEGLEETDVKRIAEYVEPQERGANPCAVCGAVGKPGLARCWRCGELPPGILPCPACGEPIPKGTYVCGHCGFGTDKAKVPPPAPAPAPVPVVVVEAAPPPAVPAVTSRVRVELTRPDQLPPPVIEAQASSTYLVKESMPEQTYSIFLDTVRKGRKGFCVTRAYPQKIREKYGIAPDVPILWLSNVGKEDSVRPKDLEKLSLALEQFIAKEAGVVLLDGIEYLITNNNFLTVLRLVQALRDTVAINGATLVVSVNPSTLDMHQMTLLEKEVDGVVTVS
jgi:isoleucyl-tRNA synthetase